MRYFNDIIIPYCQKIPDGYSRVRIPKFYGIHYNQSGTLYLRIGNGSRQTYQGSWCFLMIPEIEFEYSISADEEHNYFALGFTGERVQDYVKKGLLSSDFEAIPIQNAFGFRKKLEELEKNYQQHRLDFCVPQLEELLLLLQEARNGREFIPGQLFYQAEDLKKLLQEIRIAPQKEWNFAVEAAKLHISERHFRTLFQKIAGMPPQRFVLRERLAHAREQLLQTALAIDEIAALNGFPDPFYFSRIFKKYYGASPFNYRKEFSFR
ncbi:MAG: AraC family transcriptional regulator [Lentisphaeria bacterium]|nr:AraC family transcriptional regulator [Lentisphaeria bacterium]